MFEYGLKEMYAWGFTMLDVKDVDSIVTNDVNGASRNKIDSKHDQKSQDHNS